MDNSAIATKIHVEHSRVHGITAFIFIYGTGHKILFGYAREKQCVSYSSIRMGNILYPALGSAITS